VLADHREIDDWRKVLITDEIAFGMDPGDRKYQELHQVRAEWHVFEEYSGSNRFERVMAGAPVAFSLHFSNFGSESRADVGYEGGVNPPESKRSHRVATG
jgi:hypothetical protein